MSHNMQRITNAIQRLSLEPPLKNFIRAKKERKLLQEEETRRAEEEQRRALTCSSCGQLGHRDARSRECPNRAARRGTKRKSTEQMIEERDGKRSGRQKKASASTNVDFVANPCPHCGSRTHRSRSSKLCSHHTKSSDEILQDALGKHYLHTTRKCSFHNVNAMYKEELHAKVVRLSAYVRCVILLTHILANAYMLTHDDLSPFCFSQNYFYSITQIVRNEKVTGTNSKLPQTQLVQVWEGLKTRFPEIARPLGEKPNRVSTAISEACKTMAINYSSNIVENFEARVASYLQYKLSPLFPTLSKKAIYTLINDYAFPRIAGKPQYWPEKVVEWTPPDVAAVNDLCSLIKEHITLPVTPELLSTSPGSFVPALKFMLKELELPHETLRSGKPSVNAELPPLFSIFPNPSFKWRFISLNAELLASMIQSISMPKIPAEYHNVFFQAIDFKVFRIRSVEELGCKNGKISFANRITTDGNAMNFLFARKQASDRSIDSIQLDVNDFTEAEINAYFDPVGCDPGRTQAVTACYGSGSTTHPVRRMSTKEYYAQTGSSRRNQALQQEKIESGLADIEAQMPTAKTAAIEQYWRYIGYVLEHMDTLFAFYNASRAAADFKNYQGKQKARAEMANIFLNGGKKYNKKRRRHTRQNRRRRKKARMSTLTRTEAAVPAPTSAPPESATSTTSQRQTSRPVRWKPAVYQPSSKAPLIIFGDAMFGCKNAVHIRGKQTGVVGVLWRELKRAERDGKLVAIPLDEYCTSKVCNNCGQKALAKVKTSDDISHHGIAVCNNCRILWQRDINAAKNMFHIAEVVWKGGQRPIQFARPQRQQPQQQSPIAVTNTVSSAGV